jgi:sortase (surface protein transpeptidase)
VSRPTPQPAEGRRRSTVLPRRQTAVLLTAIGVGLVAASTALVVVSRGHAATLDLRAQRQRVLPVPGPRAVQRAFAAVRHQGAPANKRPRPPKHRRHPIWKQMSRPVRILIPAIGVSAPIVPLGLNTDHTVQVPTSFSDAGWFEPGPEPGERGPALVVGHVDSRRGPGVFFHLPALRRGDGVRIVLRSGRTLRFVVTSEVEVSKHGFPTGLVYRKTSRPTLRLVTCGGRFDRSTGHYLDNYIVFAWLAGKP